MNVPQQKWPSVVDFAHAQRCTLAAMGFYTYMVDVRPRLVNKSYIADSVLPLRGVIVLEDDLVQHFYRVGVPVWHLRRYNAVTAIENVVIRRLSRMTRCDVSGFGLWLNERGWRLSKEIRLLGIKVPALWVDKVCVDHIVALIKSIPAMKTNYSNIYDPRSGGRVHILKEQPRNSFTLVLADNLDNAASKLSPLPASTLPSLPISAFAQPIASSSSSQLPSSSSLAPPPLSKATSSSSSSSSSSLPPASLPSASSQLDSTAPQPQKSQGQTASYEDTLSFAVKFYIPDGMDGVRDFPDIHTMWSTLLTKYSKMSRSQIAA